MIPKIIHYCWFGGRPLPEDVTRYINTWKVKCPNYTIVQWNENNFDISTNTFVEQAYKNKSWAFVSDYARLKALYDFGGIYLDTDVEVLKSFDILLDNKSFMCAESNYSICTATIGAEKGSEFIKELMLLYNNKSFIYDGKENTKPNSKIVFDFISEVDGYKFSNEIFKTSDYTIYPATYFSPINCYTLKSNITDETYSIHWYKGTWKSAKERNKDIFFARITRIIGEERREELKKLLKSNIGNLT